MKASSRLLLIGLCGSAMLLSSQARADMEVTTSLSVHSAGDFYGPLSASGTWFNAGVRGRCWRPNGIQPGWRPYCDGEWVWTDCGWYWQSDEPWAWACYHYGCWYSDPSLGWVWLPGTEWAPAWVTWRIGGGYIGWAPMPPQGISIGSLGPQFVFVQAGQFQDPIRRSMVMANDNVMLERTEVFNNITHETREVAGAGRHKVVINKGPGMEIVQEATGRRINTVPIQEAARRAPVPARRSAVPDNELRNNSLRNNTVPSTVGHETPATQPPGEMPKLPPNATPRNAPVAPPALVNPTPAPRQPERTAPEQPPQREREERER